MDPRLTTHTVVGNLFQAPQRSKRFSAPRLLRGVFFGRQVRRCREPGDRV